MRINLIKVSAWNPCTCVHAHTCLCVCVCVCVVMAITESYPERLGFIHVHGVWERVFCLGQEVEEKCN